MEVNKGDLIGYFDVYKKILSKYKIHLNDSEVNRMVSLTELCFELDDVYDKNNSKPNKQNISDIMNKMKKLASGKEILLDEIDLYFKAQEQENKGNIVSLKKYLEITGVAIGGGLMAGLVADSLGVHKQAWNSNLVKNLLRNADSILRLENDMLDVTVERGRSLEEKEQEKISKYLKGNNLINIYLNSMRFKYWLLSMVTGLVILKDKFFLKQGQYANAWIVITSILELGNIIFVKNKDSGRGIHRI